MPYTLHWTEEQLDAAVKEYRNVHGLREVLDSALKEKSRQLLSVHNPPELPKRFHNVFILDGLKVAEISLNLHGKEFRAICVVFNGSRNVFLHIVTDKNNQEKTLQRMRRNAETIRQAFQGRPD